MEPTPRPASIATDRRGITLMMTMLLTLLLLVAVTGATMRTGAERRSAMDVAAQVDAFAIAQSGLDRYLNANTAVPATLPDSQSFTVPGGRAMVTLRRLRASATDTMLVLVSRGENTTRDRYAADAAMSTRTVAQLVRFRSGSFEVPAALSVLGGLDQNGTSATYSGIDQCSKAPSIAGLSVPTDSFSSSGKKGATSKVYAGIDGVPDDRPLELGSMADAIAATKIDWAGVLNGTALPPDALQLTANDKKAPTGWPAMNLGSKTTPWPIIVVSGAEQTLGPGMDGYGILIVTGDVTFSGNWDWEGIVMVGGAVTGNGKNEVRGAMFAGLNAMVGVAPGESSLSNGTKLVQYNSCHVKNALSRFGGWERMPNAWVDNWPSY